MEDVYAKTIEFVKAKYSHLGKEATENAIRALKKAQSEEHIIMSLKEQIYHRLLQEARRRRNLENVPVEARTFTAQEICLQIAGEFLKINSMITLDETNFTLQGFGGNIYSFTLSFAPNNDVGSIILQRDRVDTTLPAANACYVEKIPSLVDDAAHRVEDIDIIDTILKDIYSRLRPLWNKLRYDEESQPRSLSASCSDTESIDVLSDFLGVSKQVYLEVAFNDEPFGVLIIELNTYDTPKTAENFRQLCSEEAEFGYRGTQIHRVVPNFCFEGGVIRSANDPHQRNVGVHGKRFKDESFNMKHDEAGIVTMDNHGTNKNGCRFMITFDAVPWFDGIHVAFGKVINGLDVLQAIEKCGSPNGLPSRSIIISKCGQC